MKDRIILNSQNQFGISILRVVSTFFVIIIHVSGPLVVQYANISSFDWNVANVFDSLSRFSIPVFFMISGALLLDKDYDLKDFLKKRSFKILPAFIFWSLAYSLLNRCFFNNELFSMKKIIRDVFYGSEYHLWFIYVLLGIYLFTPILRPWIKNAKQTHILYALGLWIVTLLMDIPILKNYLPKVDLSYFSGFIGYFILGYYLTKFNIKNKFIPGLAIFIGLNITVLGTYFMSIRNNGFYDYFYEYLSINTLLVSFGLFEILNKIKSSSKRMSMSLRELNNCCYGIFLIHPLMLNLFSLLGLKVSIMIPLFSIVLVSISCFLACFLIIYGLRKLKIGYLIS